MPSPGRKRKKAAGGDKSQTKAKVDPEEERKKNEQRVRELENEYEATNTRRQELREQLQRVALPDAPGPAPRATKAAAPNNSNASSVLVPHQVPLLAKTDTHWDFVMKEMQWLSTDFTAERKRHAQSRRKLTNGVKQYFKTKESRALAALTQAESKRRKLAAKMGRDVRKFWNKMDQIVTYQQKLTYDSERHKAMNRKLVKLVQQTETYTESLVVASKKNRDKMKRKRRGEVVESDNDEDDEQMQQLKIEEALAVGQRKRRIHDYSRLEKETTASSDLYGESTTDDSGSDASFELASESSQDDETTLAQAEREEQMERNHDSTSSYAADPVELQKLQEEATMSIEAVLERLRQEPPTVDDGAQKETKGRTKRVQFANVAEHENHDTKHKQQSATSDPGEDADDDGDASDVEDFVEDNGGETTLRSLVTPGGRPGNDDGDNDEFMDDGVAVDDETTMEEEESLPQEMSAQEEIDLLQQEQNMSVEELRARYAAAFEEPAYAEEEEKVDTGNSDAEAGDGDEEFQLGSELEVDDETTIEAEEKLGRDMSYKEELAMLQRENEIPVEELRAMYSQMSANANQVDEEADSNRLDAAQEPVSTQTNRGRSRRRQRRRNLNEDTKHEEDSQDADDDAEFQPNTAGEVDDETTIEAEEKLGRDMSYDEEIAMLQRENEMSVEELRAMYAGVAEEEEEENDTDMADPEQPDEVMENSRSDEMTSKSLKRKRSENEGIESGQKTHKVEEDQQAGSETFSSLDHSAELAKNTLATRPFLLANWVKLREYQQIGLNWLVSMQARRLNGILADEMGLGKTLQTIALLSYLASYKGIWGPHLIVVPTSVIVNWETEFKRFCPGLKILCYYGSAKQRKELRTGWTKTNWNHVVITSYQLAVQDAFAFKRKRWYYLVLDEAQNIKNFQSQRWQTLINFNTQRRLLLTGTPLQNSLMELWSLLHFLMPYIFRSRKEFSFWFENPMNDMIEGTTGENASVIGRLHGIIRPFVLRRLKKDVETQMPGKYEHIVKCSLSQRQMLMYEEFMARSSTRKALRKGGNFMGMMNVLMQLRKVCNHPDLFEPRSVVTPFVFDPIEWPLPACTFGLSTNKSVYDTVSNYLCVPLWCGSRGEASVSNARQHDTIESEQLLKLKRSIPAPIIAPPLFPPQQELNEELINLELEQQMKSKEDRSNTVKFLNTISLWRCQALPFPYSNSLLQNTNLVPGKPAHLDEIISTPAQLLEMRKNQQTRAEECDSLLRKFVFCVPKSGVRPSSYRYKPNEETSFEQMLLEPVEEFLRPFNQARARLSSFFPDKKLIQFDAGKLQTLAELLRELKRGGHRTLIFTQMSKMLDILEAFLNLNGHTYMRLDGSTGVDRRQRMMDRFNNDPKIFCFILSTRSGGTGVNLVGADTVVFYDSDWNPAMDAQAQDRVHRIGQTRDCHVYRLVTEHSIEENILIKAKQKKNLDILVMDRGKFDSSHLFSHDQNARLSSDSSESQEMKDVLYSKGGLRSILGVSGGEDDEEDTQREATESSEVEKAMEELEDEDDVEALKGAKKEAAEELQEFDEIQEAKANEAETDTEEAPKQEKDIPVEKDEETEKKELEKEFQSWQTKVGMDKDAIEASLSPVERYGFKFRTDIDPYVSLYAVLEYKRKVEEEEEEEDEIDIDEIEREKSFEERQALADGDLLGTDPKPSDLIRLRNLYQREHARMKTSKKRRTLTGENWETRTDPRFKQSFWYNVDTGEGMWDKPRSLLELEEYEKGLDQLWTALPLKPLVHVMSFLQPFPERMQAARVCRQWRHGANDPSFVLHVYPVEMGAYTRDEKKIEYNHFRTIPDALKAAQPGDTVELGDGHYWINEDLQVSIPIRIVGDEHNPSRVVVEMSGSKLNWRAKGGWMEGITFRSPKLNTSGNVIANNLLGLEDGRLNLYQCAFEGSVSVSGASGGGLWKNVTIGCGVQEESPGSLVIDNSWENDDRLGM